MSVRVWLEAPVLMLDILYVVRALPVKQSKGVQISLSTPIYKGPVVKMDLSHNITNVEFRVQLPTGPPI